MRSPLKLLPIGVVPPARSSERENLAAAIAKVADRQRDLDEARAAEARCEAMINDAREARDSAEAAIEEVRKGVSESVRRAIARAAIEN